VLISATEYAVTRAGLRKWLELEDIKSRIFKATDNGDLLADAMLSYLSVAFDIPKQDIIDAPWYEVIEAYIEVDKVNQCKEFPVLKGKEKHEEYSWDYDGRTWYVWANALAKNYGWSLEYIANLDPNDAIALMQEIYVDEQIDKEWTWGLSEMAYPYNSTLKKSEFKPLPRPSWMQKVYTVPNVKIRKDFVPVGNVVRLGDWNETAKPS